MPRLIAVADSDSYLKWTHATATRLPAGWSWQTVVVRNPAQPSPAQIAAVTDGPVEILSRRELIAKIGLERPDAVLLGCTGPTVGQLSAQRALSESQRRPVLVTGLPGISIPPSARAVRWRAGCDLMIVHSRRERREFGAMAQTIAPGLRVGLTRFPFLADTDPHRDTGSDANQRVVFAGQAMVPPKAEQRRMILRALAELPGEARPVIKLRAAEGERQTHHEQFPYPALWKQLVRGGQVSRRRVTFSQGSMAAALEQAGGLVTVSSTAALEAMAVGVGVLILNDFGVNRTMINTVFAESGCLGTLDDLRRRTFRQPNKEWLVENYFHPEAESDWLDRLDDLLAIRELHGLAPSVTMPVGSRSNRLKGRLRLELPAQTWPVIRRVRRLTRIRRLGR